MVIKRNGKEILGEIKSGDFAKTNLVQFIKKECKQLNRLLEYAKNQGSNVEYYFKKGNVSSEIVDYLKHVGVNVVVK